MKTPRKPFDTAPVDGKLLNKPATKPKTVETELERRFAFIKLIGLISASSAGSSALMFVGVALFTNNSAAFALVIQDTIACVLWFGAYLLARRSSVTVRAANLISYLMVGSLIAFDGVYQIVVGNSGATPAAHFLVPIYAGIIGLSFTSVVISTALSGVVLGAVFVLEKVFHAYQPVLDVEQYPLVGMSLWLTILTIIAAGVAIFTQRLTKATNLAQSQSQQLGELLQILNANTESGAYISRELTGITAELNSTARQQASGFQEQAAAVNQVTSSLEELSETAGQIALGAGTAYTLANQALQIATEVKKAGELTQATTEEGTGAVQQTLISVSRVRDRIELLAQRLLQLTEQTRRIGAIIEIIDGIADETHLLALNASIEAAGASSSNSQASADQSGRRFDVIAQHIKSLSDRSREATEEVRRIIGEMQGAVAAAVLVAEEGRKETLGALSRSQIGGAVIEKLSTVVSDSVERAEKILASVEEVKIRCEEISLATNQQRSANQQVLLTMRGIAEVSQESAGAVSQLSETASRVDLQVDKLNNVLTKSNQVALQPLVAV